MEQFTHRLVIETAENGFLVYVNQDFSQGTIRPRPYVFESMKTLLEFVDNRFSEKQSTVDMLKQMHRPRE
jgi:hypothetical protein